MTLMDSIWHGFYFGFPAYMFDDMIRTKTTWKQLNEMLTDFRNTRNKYMSIKYDNDSKYLLHEGKRFIFGMFRDSFEIWDENDRKLGEYALPKGYENKIPTQEFCDWLFEILNNYCNGIVRCSDCGKEIRKKDIAGQYFAGIYCKDCWENKWKAIEAKETYE